MASISFPSDRPQFYSSSSFEASPPFQAGNPHHYENGSESFAESDAKPAAEDVELDEQEDKVQLEKRIRKEDVLNEMFLTSNGRDKAFKLMQYTIRLFLLVHGTVASTRLFSRPPNVDLVKRLDSTATGLSFARKLLLLFNWLSPLTTITAQQSVPFSSERSSSKPSSRPFLHTLLHHTPPPVLLELVHALADDAVIYHKLGLIGKKFGQRAERFSDWCWLLATLVGLVENGVERQIIGRLQSEAENRLYAESMTGATAKSNPKATKTDEKELKRLQRQHYWLKMTTAKLAMDFIFVSYDLLNIKRAREPVKTLTGLTAAILSSAKLYDRHKTSLLKKMLTS
ncbi:hypothetical protein M378DRAFT_121305 [Amanita muscaria Koide BX008]|uniref:Uncharacterized protein n=1 Tax=Amanita muscaria (strain Koide BX008) TaxID=946122 RepID=A0A0C2XGT5_AMAMK|nr:hypothetical protein M378DRAFT_121305 [Amanita muscaria Koide BX008]